MKLTGRLIIIIGISFFIPLIIMVIHIGIYEYNDEKLYFINTMDKRIEQAAISINKYIESIENKINFQTNNVILKRYLNQVISKEDSPAIRENAQLELNKIINLSDYILCINLIDSNNKMLISTYNKITKESIDKKTLDNMNKIGQTPFLTNFIIIDGFITFESNAPIKDDNNNIIGYISQFSDIDYFKNIIDLQTDENGSYMMFEDSLGTILSYDSEDNLNTNKRLSNFKSESNKGLKEIANEFYSKNNTSYFEYVNSKNIDVIAVSKYIPKNDMFLVYAVPKQALMTSADKIISIIMLYMLIMIFSIILISSYINKKIKKPFDEILKAIMYYENGIFSYRPSIKGIYELEIASKALFSMAERIDKVHQTLRLSEKKYKIAMEFTNDIIFSSDIKKGKFYTDKTKWEKFFNIPYDYDLNKIISNINTILYEEDINIYKNFLKETQHHIQQCTEATVTSEFRVKKPNGTYMWVLATQILFKGSKGNIDETLGSFINIDDIKNKEVQASSDYLSKLLNRSTFSFKVNGLLKQEIPSNIALLFIDIDDFKGINDEFGHKVGDDVISFIGKTINQTIEKKDIACRYGGDEFAVCILDQTKAKQSAENILHNISEKFVLREQNKILPIKCSIGIAMFPQHGTTMEELLNNADRAMYLVKKNGKCGVNIFNCI